VKKEWEKLLDKEQKLFDSYNAPSCLSCGYYPKKMRNFIQKLLDQERKEILEEVTNKIEEAVKEQWSAIWQADSDAPARYGDNFGPELFAKNIIDKVKVGG
jgi:benzoyl-CoA reductase/2-hydroxyglutaryl-CoA dehydratase subunit BcrC/BadD/HgdB